MTHVIESYMFCYKKQRIWGASVKQLGLENLCSKEHVSLEDRGRQRLTKPFGQQQNLVGGILKVFHSSHTNINWVDLNTSRAWQTKRIRRKNFLIQFGGHHNFV